jgi:hypothetical protein
MERAEGWLADVVKWWQLPNPEAVRAAAGSDFNHGERLYGHEDTIRRAVAALPSSKALAVLIDADEAGDPTREYPALAAVQLHTRTTDSGTLLDVVGIYRKQDLRLWWPVNMAELAYIQRHALEFTGDNAQLHQPVAPGRLIAIASISTHDNVLPQLAGTALDRALDLQPGWPYRLALLASQPRAETLQEWTDALADVGVRDGDKVLVPTIGLQRLHDALLMHNELGPRTPRLRAVIDAVAALNADAIAAAGHLAQGPMTTLQQTYWASKLRSAADDVLSAL